MPAHPIFYGVPIEVIATVCGVTRRCARKYKEGLVRPPTAAVKLLELHTQRRILGPEFDGWAIHGDVLIDPEGHRSSQSQLRAYAFVWQFCRELTRDDPNARRELDRIASIALRRAETLSEFLEKEPLSYDDLPGVLLKFGNAK